MSKRAIQYVYNERCERTREISSERETQYLLSSESMRRRLEAAMKRTGGVPAEEAFTKLGLR